MSSMLRHALRYATRYGWRVFPLNGKEPMTPNGFRDATVDSAQVEAWWTEWPRANIGIACDSEHGPIVIDIDAPKHHESSGFSWLDSLDLSAEGMGTRSAISQPGRMHLYFAPMRDGTAIRRMIRPFRLKGAKVAIDVLGDGGYVVAPPSIHPDTDKPYAWKDRATLAPFPKRLFRFVAKHAAHAIAAPLPPVIREGERDTLLTSMAGSMRRRNASPEAILAALRVENITRVRPPLDDASLRRIAKSIGMKAPATAGENHTDLGNARRFIALYANDFRSVVSKGRNPWYTWSGTHWERDAHGEAMRRAKETVRAIHDDAAKIADQELSSKLGKHAQNSESAERLRALLAVAATEPEVILRLEQFDCDHWLFNVRNGTLDLQTGKLRKHDPLDYITKLSPVDFDRKATAPMWQNFLRTVLHDDDALIDFVQRAVGYSLTGDTREHKLFFCYGQGRNGKSTFFEVIRHLLSAYAIQSDFDTFQTSLNNSGAKHDLARMHGARFVSAVEARGDRAFDATMLKQATGEDTLSARRLYEESFDFKPQFKLWLAANHLPLVHEQTEAFWSRIMMVPFTVRIPTKSRIKGFSQTLIREELPGILNWAVEGCRLWHTSGLQIPDSVRKATREYQEEYDVLSEFITARCVLDAESWLPRPKLYQAFSDWWVDTRGRNVMSSIAFNRLLGERRDMRAAKRKGVKGWYGLNMHDVHTKY